MSSWNKITRRPADITFSNFIRLKAKGKCEYCGKVCWYKGTKYYQLEASHYFSRAKESVRFDERNVHALCSSCHKRMGGYTNKEDGEYDLWIKQLLGEKGYILLKLEAHLPHKRDDKLVLMVYKDLLKKLESNA